jgi:hypothetical protein
MRRALICALPLLLLAAPSHTETAADAVEQFGLIGTWAVDCNQSPSPRNEHALFSVTSIGTAQLRNDFGRDYDEMVYRIVAASLQGPDKLALRQVLTTDDAIVLDVVLVKSDEKVRIWSSRSREGNSFVRQGAIPSSNGQETRWSARCDGRWTDNPTPNTDLPQRTVLPNE